jgi:hypothetical protein
MQATNVEVAEYLGEMLLEMSKVASAGGMPALAARLLSAAMEARTIAGKGEWPGSSGEAARVRVH